LGHALPFCPFPCIPFNVYVSGIPGTGKTTAVKRFLLEEARDRTVPNDLCYVNNCGYGSLPSA